jgi:hypothetical protein
MSFDKNPWMASVFNIGLGGWASPALSERVAPAGRQ